MTASYGGRISCTHCEIDTTVGAGVQAGVGGHVSYFDGFVTNTTRDAFVSSNANINVAAVNVSAVGSGFYAYKVLNAGIIQEAAASGTVTYSQAVNTITSSGLIIS